MWRKLVFVVLLACMLVAGWSGAAFAQEQIDDVAIRPDTSRGVGPEGQAPLIGGETLIPLPNDNVGILLDRRGGGFGTDGIDDGNWSIFAQKNETAARPPDFVHWAHEWDCNDAWVGWNNVSATKRYNLGVWATQGASQLHINRTQPAAGLNGIASCVNLNCTIRMCTKHGWFADGGFQYWADAWSVRLRVP